MHERVELNDETETPDSAPATEPVTEETPEDRPEWLPEKFGSPEAMVQAYAELERKQSSDAPDEADQVQAPALTQEALQEYSNAWQQQDYKFTDEQYGELEKMGLPREIVDLYAEGQLALVQSQATELVSTIGGEENYKAMAEWAQSTLSEAEINAYDKAIELDKETAKMAVQGMYAQYIKAVGKAPNLVQGTQAQPGSEVFHSIAEVRAAMGDPRYKTDAAYRQSVANRVAASNI
jgi:protein-tyrosine-phosphatase